MSDALALGRPANQPPLSPIADVLCDLAAGRMAILVNDQGGAFEGALVAAAARATPEVVNLMARHGRGLVCLALTAERVARLGLPLMPRRNASRQDTVFAVSIEARHGVSTGISAEDRARTIAVAIDPAADPTDIVTPGHVFPLVARDGGVLAHPGQAEAAVDLAALAGLGPCGVVCTVMGDGGAVADPQELAALARALGVRMAGVADLVTHRRRTETLVRRVVERDLDSRHGGRFRLIVYRSIVDGVEHVALVKGAPAGGEPMPVRVHSVNLLDDILGDRDYARGGQLHAAMARMEREGRGVVVLIREAHNSSPSEHLRERELRRHDSGSNPRDLGIAAQILTELGVGRATLLTTREQDADALERYGVTVAACQSV